MARKSLETIGISCILYILLISPLKAQVFDGFIDGNLTSNPPWTGDTNKFEVNSLKQLHLKSSGTDSSFVVTESHLRDSTEWNFWVKLSFSASANNYCRIYLLSDNADLTQALNGFYLQLGEAGSSDAIELFRQQGVDHYSVCRGKEGYIASSFAIRIRLTRDVAGNWTLSADSLGGNVFLEQATGWDNTAVNPLYTGIYCKYTSSNATKFYFDDVVIKPIEVDLSAPLLTAIRVPDLNHLELSFSEAIDPVTLADVQHYQADQGLGYPSSVSFSASNLNKVIVYYSTSFIPLQQYNLTVSGLTDLAGNTMFDTTLSFLYYRSQAFDVVINEIMADPEPQVGLPPVEYLELYNTSDYDIDLEGWELQIGSTFKPLETYNFPSKSYLLLADSNARPLFGFLNFMGFPSFTLSNEGATITLLNKEKQLIHSVSYSADWYDDPLKKDGGWALEQIDPLNPCAGKENWRCSTSNKGGTPGIINSVKDDNPDNSAPKPEFISVTDPRNITVFFSESLDSTSLYKVTSFRIMPGDLPPDNISLHKPEYNKIDLELASSMETGKIYTLVFMDSIKDCAGNVSISGYTMPFGLPQPADTGDVVINEILFDPETDEAEFFEINNISNKIISLNSLIIAETDSLTLQIGNKYELSKDNRLLFPGDYLAFTSDPLSVLQHYQTIHPEGISRMQPFPSFVNTGDCFSLVNRQDQLIDAVIYLESMHYPLLHTTKGVSLERISGKISGIKHDNWHSASSACGYATPAMKNSQAIEGFISESDISLNPAVFSPDNDGYQDIQSIQCKLDKPGFLANISVFNTAGQLVRTLVTNSLLGNENLFIWDGIDNRGYKSPIGMYILFFEFFNTSGEVIHFKKVSVLAGKLK